jgi:hypothetical protein
LISVPMIPICFGVLGFCMALLLKVFKQGDGRYR